MAESSYPFYEDGKRKEKLKTSGVGSGDLVPGNRHQTGEQKMIYITSRAESQLRDIIEEIRDKIQTQIIMNDVVEITQYEIKLVGTTEEKKEFMMSAQGLETTKAIGPGTGEPQNLI